ncbi:endonuclease/exonuclease/phosphatase family protein [Butyrivibrio sp. XPD2006]|uniref:endonuclease/exonuclease/phosphatase family protein n=1 Tax=Butyrivibrio sp. XPD2006 TaxID=1280668 RepID=UPI0003B799E2|nr:endonuclease/exonuclease/phosphatase family protein [Butyrivibrio sp. XPD2006]
MKNSLMKKVITAFLIFVLLFIFAWVTLFAYLTVDEYRPEEVENLQIAGEPGNAVSKSKSIRIMSWNIGYGALGDNSDFFMDGGTMVYTADEERVSQNLDDIDAEVDKIAPDILITQETDVSSARARFINEPQYLAEHSEADVFQNQNLFSYNYKVSFVPLPIPPIGKVHSGLATFSKFAIDSAERIALPCPFKWPLRTINLKRGLQEIRMPIEGSDRELVIINFHLEAYDSGEGKIAQTKLLKQILIDEFEKGNYVIAGGDFNQQFSNVDTGKYAALDGIWQAPVIDVAEFGDDFRFLADPEVPTCRSLDKILVSAPSRDYSDFQYYVIDGFIVSKNIEVEQMYTEDLGFVCSDHNPVVMDFKLR